MRQNKYFLTTDSHLFHEGICDWGGRPKDFTERIITNWKYYLQPQDTLIHLGDVIFKNHEKLKEILDSVPGIKILIRGNHDKQTDSWYCRRGFSFVCNEAVLLDGILLSHKPRDLRNRPNIKYNIFGHWHSNDIKKCIKADPEVQFFHEKRHLLLALEYCDYKPIDLQSFIMKPPLWALTFKESKEASAS